MKLPPVSVNSIAANLIKTVAPSASLTENAGKLDLEFTTYKETIETLKENQKENQSAGSKVDVYA